MSGLVIKVLGWQGIVKQTEIVGEIPSNRDIYKRTFSIAWPSALESVMIALIGAVDTAMVGTISKEAISAVGITTQPKFIILAPILALNIGVTVLTARRKGEGNRQDANQYLSNAVIISIALAVILSVLGIVFAREFLLFAGASADYIDLAVTYFRIIEIGNIFYSIGLTITAAQRGIGKTKISMITNLAANLINLVFNALLINGLLGFPKLGVTGAAIATVIGNVVSFVIAVISVTSKNGYLNLNFAKLFRPHADKMLDIWNIAKNTLIEQLFMRAGFFIYAKMVASLGTAPYAAHMVCMNVMTISFGLGEGLQIANTSLVGQSMGRKRVDMAKIYTGITKRIGIIIAVILSISVILLSDQIAGLFTTDVEVIQLCEIPLTILSLTVLFQIPQVIIVGALRGAGDVRFVAILMLVSVALVRPTMAYILSYPAGLGLNGAWIALFIDQLTRNLISSWRFSQGKWKEINV